MTPGLKICAECRKRGETEPVPLDVCEDRTRILERRPELRRGDRVCERCRKKILRNP